MTMPLLLPTDGCDNCMTIERSFPVHPYRVAEYEDGTGLTAWYCCPQCGRTWFTGWDISALALPCPGCPACGQEAGAA